MHAHNGGHVKFAAAAEHDDGLLRHQRLNWTSTPLVSKTTVPSLCSKPLN
jgi:hypothetical protein